MPRTIVIIVTLPNLLIQSMSVCLITLTYWSNYPDVVLQRVGYKSMPNSSDKSEHLNVRGDITTSAYSVLWEAYKLLGK